MAHELKGVVGGRQHALTVTPIQRTCAILTLVAALPVSP